MFEFFYRFYFIVFLLACICGPYLLACFIINLLVENKRLSVVTILSFVLCVIIYLTYASPDYSRAKFSDSTINKVFEITEALDNEDIWEIYFDENEQKSYTCHWGTETTLISVEVYPRQQALLNDDSELYIDEKISFLLFGKKEKTEAYQVAIYPRIIYRVFLEVVPDYADTQIEILDEERVISVTMLNKTWDKKDDVAINEFLSDLFDGTNNGEFCT